MTSSSARDPFGRARKCRAELRLLLGDRFDTLERIGEVAAPTLFIHATGDTNVPIAHSRALFAAAKAPKTFGAEGKARTLKMVDALEKALGEDIQKLLWMTAATKKEAIVKLHAEDRIEFF